MITVEPTIGFVVEVKSGDSVEVLQSVGRVVEVVTEGPQGAKGEPGGSTFSVTAGENLGGHRVVATNGADAAVYASSLVLNQANMVLGMTTAAVSVGGDVNVIRQGEVEEPSWNWTIGSPVYLGNNGVLTQTLPNGAAFSLIVGFPVTPTKLFIALREPIILS